jgi:glycine betaine transporter
MLVVALIALMLFMPSVFITHLEAFNSWFHRYFTSFILWLSTVFLLVCLALCFSKWGRIKLGRQDEKPEYSTLSWMAMLFAAGMGSGLTFWGVAEPLTHFVSAPPLLMENASEQERMLHAMMVTHVHWVLHPWAIYCISALVAAYFAFRHNKPLLPGVAVRAFSGSHSYWRTERVINVVAVLAVVFGLVATISMASLQIATGIRQATGTGLGVKTMQMIVIGLMGTLYIISAATPLRRGIKLLSNLNMTLCFALLLFVLFMGPTRFIFELLLDSVQLYAREGMTYGFKASDDAKNLPWLSDWTIAYYLWWVAWTPFVGVFIARISRGRTIREFILGVLILPCILTILWFSALGGAALYAETINHLPLSDLMQQDYAQATYALLQHYPFYELTRWLVIALCFIFIVTSADSGTYVLGMFSENGAETPSVPSRLFWGGTVAILSLASVNAASGIDTVRSVAATGAIPFLFIMILQLAALLVQLWHDRKDTKPLLSPYDKTR